MTLFVSCRCDGCEAVLLGIEQQVLRANQYKENHHRTQQQVEMEVGTESSQASMLLDKCLFAEGNNLVMPG